MTEDILKPKKNCEYKKAPDVEQIIKHLVDIGMYPKLEIEKMTFLRSTKKKKKEKKYTNDEAGKIEKMVDDQKSKRPFIARVVTLNKLWKEIYGDKTVHYCIEVAAENYDPLTDKDKLRVMIHECYHIPEDFEMGKMHKHDEFSNIHILYGRYNELVKDDDKKV